MLLLTQLFLQKELGFASEAVYLYIALVKQGGESYLVSDWFLKGNRWGL
jgi:hypothetical protein